MINHLLNAVAGLGNLVDLPGSSVRDALAWRNPLDQYLTPFSDENRTSGRELLRRHGLIGQQNTWGNFAGGLAAETLLDPTNLISGKAVLNLMRARRMAQQANKGIHTANALSTSQRAMGFMPEEIARNLHPSLLGPNGQPKVMYHGTPHAFDRFDTNKLDADALYGKGIYTTDTPTIASSYSNKGMQYYFDNGDDLPRKLIERARQHGGDDLANNLASAVHSPDGHRIHQIFSAHGVPIEDLITPTSNANVRMHFLDIRNPLNMEATTNGVPFAIAGEFATTHRSEARSLVKRAKSLRNEMMQERANSKLHAIGSKAHDRATIRYNDANLSLLELQPKIKKAFTRRNGPTGQDIYDRLGQEAIQNRGFDGITHLGGKHIKDAVEHNVAIAFDPSQVYKPYVAPAIKPDVPVPSGKRIGAGLAAYGAVVRGRRREE